MLEVADVFRRYGHEYLDRFGQDLLPSTTVVTKCLSGQYPG
jgi:hypothetical protein